MNTWNSRLAEALAQSSYNPHSFAKEMGVSAPTVSGWIGAANIKPTEHIKSELMLRACGLLKIRPQWLIFNEGPMREINSEKISDEMSEIIALLIAIDRHGGTEREDLIEIVKRYARHTSHGYGSLPKANRLP